MDLLALVAFPSIAFFLLGRFISTGAAKLLSEEEKARLVDFTVQQRKLILPVALGLIAVVFFFSVLADFLLLVFLVAYLWYQQSKLASMSFPKRYRRRLLIGTLISYSGLAALLLIL